MTCNTLIIADPTPTSDWLPDTEPDPNDPLIFQGSGSRFFLDYIKIQLKCLHPTILIVTVSIYFSIYIYIYKSIQSLIPDSKGSRLEPGSAQKARICITDTNNIFMQLNHKITKPVNFLNGYSFYFTRRYSDQTNALLNQIFSVIHNCFKEQSFLYITIPLAVHLSL